MIILCEAGWIIEGHVDDDNHLTLIVKNNDESPIHETGDPNGFDDNEFITRFTTDQIEKDFQNDRN